MLKSLLNIGCGWWIRHSLLLYNSEILAQYPEYLLMQGKYFQHVVNLVFPFHDIDVN